MTLIDSALRPDDAPMGSFDPETKLRYEDEVYGPATLLLTAVDLDWMIQGIVDEATSSCGAEHAAFIYNVTRPDDENRGKSASSSEPRRPFAHPSRARRTAIFSPTFNRSGVLRLDDVERDPRYGKSEFPRGPDQAAPRVRSYLAVPVRSRSGDGLGGLFFGHSAPCAFDARHEGILLGIASRAALAIENARILAAAHRAEEALARTLAAEQAARADAERERARIADLFSKAPAAIATWRGKDHVFEFANPRYEQLFGRKNLVGLRLREAFSDLGGQGIYEIFDRVYRTGEPLFATELRVLYDRDGSGEKVEGFFSCNLEPVYERGAVAGLMVVAIDVTAEVHARRAQAESERRLRVALAAADTGIWEQDPILQKLTWDARCKAIFGLSADAPVDDDVFHAGLHPEDRDRVDAAVRRALDPAGPGELDIEYRVIGIEDGVERWAAAQGRTFFEEGHAIRLTGSLREITARKNAEHALLQGARRAQLGAEVGAALAGSDPLDDQLRRCAQAIVTNLDAAFARIWMLDDTGRVLVLRASRGMYTHLDGPHSRVPVGSLKIGRIAEERVPHLTNDVLQDPRVGDKAWAEREGLVAFAGYPFIVDDRIVGVMAMFSRRPLGTDTLHALGYVADTIAVGIERRCSEERRAAQAYELRKSEQRYRSLIDASAQTTWTNDPSGKMVGEQPAWAALTGQTEAEYRGDGWLNAVHPDDRDRTASLWREAVRTGEVLLCEHRVRRHDGAFRHFTVRGVRVLAEDGSVREWFGVHSDVTEKKTAELERERLIAALRRSNEDLDQFAYVTSHDLKAPLRGIANLSQWVEEDLADKLGDEGHEQMRLLRGRVHRLEALINGILSYSRAGRTQEKIEPVDLGRLTAEVVELLAPPEGVTIEIPADLPTLETERVPLQQVLMNLISNGIKYARRSDPRISITCVDAGQGHEITVTDNGPGIAPEFHRRIWGIFQTLEPRDKVEATGIGLAIVKKVVESRGGRVWIDSALGAGASFHFLWLK